MALERIGCHSTSSFGRLTRLITKPFDVPPRIKVAGKLAIVERTLMSLELRDCFHMVDMDLLSRYVARRGTLVRNMT